MNLADVMDQVAEQLDTIAGLRVAAYPDGGVNVPCAIVTMPEGIDFDQTYGRGSDSMVLPVVVLVSGAVPRKARDALGVYCDGSGAKSVKAVLEAGEYTAFDTIRVSDVKFDVYEIGAIGYPAAIFSIDITGSGQ